MASNVGHRARGGWKLWIVVLLAALAAVAAAVVVSGPVDSAVGPRISVSPQDVAPGASVTTEGYGFPQRTRGTVTFAGKTVARFEDFVSYKKRNEAVWLRGRNHRVVGATLADIAIGATFASEESFLINSLVVGQSRNLGSPRSWETTGLDGRSLPRFWEPGFPIRGFEFYDGRVGVRELRLQQPASGERAGRAARGRLLAPPSQLRLDAAVL